MADVMREREILRGRLLGQGLACPQLSTDDHGRDLDLVVGPHGLDLARVSGMDNLGQSLRVALTTLLGSDLFNTSFGFDGLNALASETDPILLRERLRIAIIQVLRKEPRVRRIVDVKIGDDRLEAPVAGSRELDVRVRFETVTGEQGSADLGG
jgi:phage baseplate assembly protein W